MSRSLLTRLRDHPDRATIIAGLSGDMVVELAGCPWWATARPEQLPPPGGWHVWLILAGRGFGKGRAGSEWMAGEVTATPKAPGGAPTEWAIIGETFPDVRNICVEGPSGILRALDARNESYVYNKSSWVITCAQGQRIHLFSADNPDAGRGLNLSGAWLDELAKWRHPKATWDEGIVPALRIGKRPRAVVTTTPKPVALLQEWVGRDDGTVAVTTGSTFDNADNLSETALDELRRRYEGTRVGRQELHGELLTESEGALWSMAGLDEHRVREAPSLDRVVVAIDPAVTSGPNSDETGIVTVGKAGDHYYVLADDTGRLSPDGWARRAVTAYERWGADRVIGEVNNGGDLIESVLRQVAADVPYRKVTASRGKRTRAEPVAALAEQGRVHMVGGLPDLESQLITWEPGGGVSPDRLDAMVWAVTELSTRHQPANAVSFTT